MELMKQVIVNHGNKLCFFPFFFNFLQPVDRAELLAALKTRAELLTIPELPRTKLHLVQRIASGAFGTVYKAEAENIPEYGSGVISARRLVAAKYLPNTSEKDKYVRMQETKPVCLFFQYSC